MAVRSIHAEFDGAVACLRATADALHAAQRTLAAARALVDEATLGPEAMLAALRALLQSGAEPSGGVAGVACATGPSVEAWQGSPEGLVEAVQQRLPEWEALVQSHQSPSRVLRWAGGA